MSNSVTNWLRSQVEPRTEPVDHRQLIKWSRRVIVAISLVTLAIAGSMLLLGMSETLICAVTVFLLSIVMIPTALLCGAEIHTWYWIALVKYGYADEHFLPPLPERYEVEYEDLETHGH